MVELLTVHMVKPLLDLLSDAIYKCIQCISGGDNLMDVHMSCTLFRWCVPGDRAVLLQRDLRACMIAMLDPVL
jgi:hypothetical protein